LKTITVDYTLDNDSWSEEVFENSPIESFTITQDMILDILKENLRLVNGDYIHEIMEVKPTQYIRL
jgi:hypothetical protein